MNLANEPESANVIMVPSMNPLTATAHTLSLGAVIASLLGAAPAFAAIGAAVWYTIQIWETSSAKKFRDKLANLKANWRLGSLLTKIAVAVSAVGALGTQMMMVVQPSLNASPELSDIAASLNTMTVICSILAIVIHFVQGKRDELNKPTE